LRRAVALAALLVGVSACHHDQNAVLLIVVTASGTPPTVASLNVTLSTSPSRTAPSMNRYAADGPDPITFPTTLSAEIPSYATGDVSVDVRADDASGTAVASGHLAPFPIRPGEHKTVYVPLDCGGDTCIVDGGTGNDDGGVPEMNPRCGNGRVDPGETCDTAIAPGDPGGCPLSCDDQIPCTRDTRMGSDCTVSCVHVEIRDPAPGDDCCPAGASYDGQKPDSDCSRTCGNGVVDKGETCDTAITPGKVGACPTAADCKPITCAQGDIISGGTCSAVCSWTPFAPSGKAPDNCCPPGATNDNDIDCPSVCGNGVRETAAGEACDTGIPSGAPGACAKTCDDGNACTIEYLVGIGCQSQCSVPIAITAPISGDGCCPPGATNVTDDDCPPECGNGVLERGETCDRDSCPTACPVPPPGVFGKGGCLLNQLVGKAHDCNAHCEITTIDACNPYERDGCCPEGCSPEEDRDCSAACGDGLIEPTFEEECDTALRPGQPGTCPVSCDDHNPCTDDYLVGAGCAARCVHMPVTDPRPGDGCCLPGRTFYLDPDCPSICGDGIVDRPAELCDFGAGAGCPDQNASCGTPDVCTTYAVTGRADNCSAACVGTPITACVGGDGCCPAGCTAVDDGDCPSICGDGVVETSEFCDRAITAGQPGACARTCDDGDACTFDQASGSVEGCSRSCTHAYITGCISNDGCCPAACTAETDSDCAPTCGDNRVGAGETCDPPSSCPTSCRDDGDPCTTEQLTGSSETCNTACRHVPITACSGTTADRCCPTGCTGGSDTDC